MTEAAHDPTRACLRALLDDPQSDEQELEAVFVAYMTPQLIATAIQHAQTKSRGALLLNLRGTNIRDIRGQDLPFIYYTPALAEAHGIGWPTDEVAAAVQTYDLTQEALLIVHRGGAQVTSYLLRPRGALAQTRTVLDPVRVFAACPPTDSTTRRALCPARAAPSPPTSPETVTLMAGPTGLRWRAFAPPTATSSATPRNMPATATRCITT
jgi:hypothetical protein